MLPSKEHIVVIGAGIVGTCCAAVLRRKGFRVTLIDKAAPCSGTSRGNAGAIAVAEIMPLASPGIITKAPSWLLDPLGPLSIRPGYLPVLLPWLYQFWRASSSEQVRRSATALASLTDMSVSAWRELASGAGIAHKLHTVGELHVYQGKRRFDAARWAWSIRKELGVKFESVAREEIARLEPALSDTFTHGIYVPDWIQVTDPFEVGSDIANDAISRGVQFLSGLVTDVRENNGSMDVLLDSGAAVTCNQVVLAGGAWSHKLSRQWGDRFPLEAERGYNTTFPSPNLQIRRQITFADHGFVISPLSCGLRVGGAVELAGLEAPPNFKRSGNMVVKAKKFLPELDPGEGVEWMGQRPSLPDSLPVIGRSEKRPNLLYAFGHGHLGLTQAGATAKIVADLACRTAAEIDITPFSPDRF